MTRRTIRTAATCSVMALATALAASPAAAQVANGSFQGTPTTAFGTVTVNEGPGTTDIQVDSSSAVLDWTPDDNATANNAPILFQPAGTTATFHNNATTGNDFAILNRIVPADATRPIIFDGTVISELRSQINPTVQGGTVFFYSPGGIIVGANAVFDVGNLGLTTAAPLVDGSGNWYVGNQVQFQQAASGSFVDIDPGAQISALAEGSYVAVFAPYVEQGGLINVNGQAALVAGEAGTITFSPDGLFNIQVTIGTDGQGGFGIEHSGTTTGPASSGSGDNHRIYMVAIPKNSLLTLGIERGSTIGFDIAGAADMVGNAVILSAGRNVVGDAFVAPSAVDGGSISINDSNTGLTGTGIDFTSKVTAVSTDNTEVNVFRQTNFAADALLIADDIAAVSVDAIPADSVGALTVGGQLVVDADFGPLAQTTGDAGSAFVFAQNGGSIDVSGDLTIRALGVFDRNGDGVVQGGTSQLLLDTNGTVDVGGSLLMNGSAFASSTVGGPDALGGTTQALLFGGSSLTVAGIARIASYGIAGDNNGLAGAGGDGEGGFASVFVSEGSSATFNELNIAANGVGGIDVGGGAGTGTGGSAQITVDGPGSVLTVTQANVTGDVNLGELDLVGATGIGGAATQAGTSGGTGQGGFAGIVGTNGATINLPTLATGPAVPVLARGVGGVGTVDGTTGGTGIGGSIGIFLDNSSMNVANLLPSLAGIGGAAGSAVGVINGGDGIGGDRNITLVNGASFTGSIIGGTSGGVGGDANEQGQGGNGSGGSTFMVIDNSTFTVTGDTFIIGQAAGGFGAIGGNAVAGTVDLQLINGAVFDNTAGVAFEFTANAFGGNTIGTGGSAGGNGQGGTANATVDNATINGDFAVGALGRGGDVIGSTVIGASAGNGTGGVANLFLRDATVSGNQLQVSAAGIGGAVDAAGNTGLAGGTGTGGAANLFADSGSSSVTVANTLIDAIGTGGAILHGSGTAGGAIGGSAGVNASNAAGLVFNGLLEVIANGDAGDVAETGTGGDATSGFASVSAIGGADITVNGNLNVDGSATGGDGTTGGAASFDSSRDQAVLDANGGTISVMGATLLTANATGGSGITGAGGAATSGDVIVNANNGGTMNFSADVNADSIATGGASVDGNGGNAAGGLVLYIAQAGGAIVASNPNANMSADSSALAGDASGLGNGGDASFGMAQMFVDGGAITINGNLGMQSLAQGGDGINGGNAIATLGLTDPAETLLTAQNGTITVLGQTGLVSEAIGGDGAAGGSGGEAVAGAAIVDVFTLPTGEAARIELGDLAVGSVATGGNGGAGITNGVGGAGGRAFSSAVQAFATAGNGTLVVNGSTQLSSLATGGDGGAGGSGTSGGAGGVGGDAQSGRIQFGTRSGQDSPNNAGSATFADVTAQSVATGGLGGDGGAIGTTGQANGGNGGNAISNGGVMLVRGSPVTVTDAIIQSVGLGGDGGAGGVDGAGGYGAGGDVSLVASQRFERTDRGSATANSVSLQSIGIGGMGSTDGASYYAETGGMNVQQSDATVGSFSYVNQGSQAPSFTSVAFDDNGQLVTATHAPQPIELVLVDGQVTAGSISMFTPGQFVLNLDSATLDVGNLSLQAGSFVLPSTAPVAPGTITVSSGLNLTAAPGAPLVTYANFVTDFGVTFNADADFRTGDFTANGGISIDSANGTVTTGNLNGTSVSVSGNAVTVGNVTTTGPINLLARIGSVLAGNLTGDSVIVEGNSVTVGNVGLTGQILLTANGGSVVAGDITGDFVGIEAVQNITTGDITSASDISLQAQTGTVSTGVLAGTNIMVSGGQDIVIGDYSSPGDVFFQSLSGSLTTGNLSGANVSLFAAQDITAANIDAAGEITIEAGNRVNVNGTWTAPLISVISNDINIGSAGLLDAGDGIVQLLSLNPGGMFVGDGVGGTTGYTLGSAEFGRIAGGEILIGAIDFGSSGPAITIGNLAISGNQLGASGSVVFATGNLETFEAGGTIRVDGQINATGMSADNFLEFYADTVEINAVTGGISSSNASGGLGGIVLIEADNIHVASPAVLQRLREDPFYQGHIEDLNRAGVVDRPDGVLRALGLQLFPGETLYIQNTGTATNPAGFYTTVENSDIEPPGFEDPSAPDVEVVINGRFASAGGGSDVTGRDVFDAIIANAESSDGFAPTSQVNGCAIGTSVCTMGESSPAPTNTAELQVLTEDQSQEEPFDTEESDDDDDEAEQEASAPIAPPVVLINTSPLNPDVDVDDPVSGTGNPALIGASLSENAQGDQQ